MTRDETLKLMDWYERNRPAMHAYSIGKPVESQSTDGTWGRVLCPVFGTSVEYRPALEPTLRPYSDAELKEQVGKVFVHKHSDVSRIVTEAGIGWVRMYNHPSITAAELLEQYKQVDGSPCGVTE